MTLIVAIPASDGVVFGSDSQITAEPIRFTGRKIHELNKRAMWSASGELALIQRVQEKLGGFTRKDQPLTAVRDDLANLIKTAVEEIVRLDFRTQFFTGDPDTLLKLHPGDFIFVEYQDGARILHITSYGTPEWIEWGFAATGIGDVFAYTLLAKYAGIPLTCERAKLLAYKVIEEAINVGSYGLGPPIDIWEVGRDGSKQVSQEEIAALEDAARLLRGAEVELLAPKPLQEPAGPAQAAE